MNQEIKEVLYKMWLERPEYIKASHKQAQQGEILGRFMIIPQRYGLYISILVGDEVSETSIQSEEEIDFIRGDVRRRNGKDIFEQEAIAIIDKYDLKFKQYGRGKNLNKKEIDTTEAARSITDILIAMIEDKNK